MTCKHCNNQIHRDEKGVWIDNSGGDVCGWNGGNEPHIPQHVPHCQTCGNSISRYQHRTGKGLCKPCVMNAN